MSHLTPEELLDLVEDASGADVRDPLERDLLLDHVAECADCRRQLDDARSMMTALGGADVEEPSPLFWDHLSARVREAVDEERAQSVPRPDLQVGRWIFGFAPWRFAASAASLAVVLVAAVLFLDRRVDAPIVEQPAPEAIVAGRGTGADAAATLAAEEASLSLLADLAGELTWDDVSQAGLMTRSGAIEEAVIELTDDERIELHRLLKEELSKGQGV